MFIFVKKVSMICKNCDVPFNEDFQFCPHCGGRVVNQRVTTKSLLIEFAEKFLSYDNKFAKTFRMLFKAPETVINGYLKGARHKYINPFTYLLISITISGLNIYLMKKGFYGEINFTGSNDAKIENFDMQNFTSSIFDYHSFISTAFIPFFALLSKLVFWKRKDYNFAEHNIIYCYTYNHVSILTFSLIIVLGFFVKSYMTLSALMYPIIFGYHFYALKRIFNLTIKQLILKSLLFFVLLAFFYIVILFIIGMLMFKSML